MPFVDESDRQYDFGSLDEAARQALAAPVDTGPGFFDTIGAGFRQENTVFNVYQWLTDERPDLSDPARSGFNPFSPENLGGYERDARQFIGVDSLEEMDWIKMRLDREREDDEILAASGPGGMAARLLGGLIDPLMLIPVGGSAVKAYRAGQLLRSGLLTMWTAGVGATAAEGILHANQYDRDLGESAWAVGGSLMLGGLIGGGAAVMGRRASAKAAAEIEEHLNGFRDLTPHERQQGLSPAVAGGTGDDMIDIPQAMFDAQDELIPGSALHADLEIQRVLGLKTAARLSPALDVVVRGQDKVSRSIVYQMVDVPVRTVSHSQGRVGATTVIREGEPGPIAGRQGTVVTKEQSEISVGPDGTVDTVDPLVKGVRAGSIVDILEDNPRSYTIRATVENKVPAHRVRFEGQPTVVEREVPIEGVVLERPSSRLAPSVRGQVKAGKKGNASETDVGDTAKALEDRLGRSFTPDELLSELRIRGFTGTEAEGAFPVQPVPTGEVTFDVVNAQGEIISSHAKKKDANAAVRAGTTFDVIDEAGLEVQAGISSRQAAVAMAGKQGKVFDVVDADGSVVGTQKTIEGAHAQADLGFAGEGALGDLDGVPVTVLSREGDDYIVAQQKTMKIQKSSIRPDHEPPFTPKVVESEDPNFVNVEGRIKLYRAKLGKSIESTREKWYEYRLGLAGSQDSFTARRMLDARERAAGVRGLGSPTAVPDFANGLSYRQFGDEVTRALRAGDEGRLPEASAAAKVWRDEIFEPMGEDILALKLLPGIIKNEDGISYMMRSYDQQAMKDNPEAWDLLVRQWANVEHKQLNDGDVTQLAIAIREKITGSPSGRNPYEGFDNPGLSAPLNHRIFNISDKALDDAGFLINDIEAVGSMYVHSVAPDLELTRTFGSFNMEKQLDEMTRSFQIREAALKNRKDIDEPARVKGFRALEKERKRAFQVVEGLRDRLRGTFAAPKDPNNFSTRFQRGIRSANVLAHSGGFMISSWPDVWRAAMVHGFTRTFRDGILPLARSMADANMRKMATRELQDAGIGWELVIDSRALSLMDIGQDRLTRGSWGEAALNNAGRNVAKVNLLAQWNRGMKQFSGYVTQARMMRAMEGMAAGKITDKELAKLAEQGISEATGLRMAGLARKHGEIRDGFRVAHTDKWAEGLEGEAAALALGDARLFRAATLREVDKIIVTPGAGDLPFWTSSELGKTLFQYRSFGMASVSRTMLAGLQQNDAAVYSGALMSLGMGMVVAAVKTAEAGKADELQDWELEKWIREGVDRSGLIGIWADVHNTLDKVNLGVSRLTGGPQATRYAARNTLSSLLGPSFGLAETLPGLISSVSKGEITQRDTRDFRRLLPYQNLFWARSTFDMVEQSVNDAFGIPERARSSR